MTDYRFRSSWRIVKNSCRNGHYHIFKVENQALLRENLVLFGALHPV